MEGRMLVAEEKLADHDAQLKAAREALEIARQETRIAAVMLDQVEPSAAITVKESDRLHLAANKMRTVSDLSDKALAALDGEKKGDIDERN
jgi:ABC-type Fe2+-enterobactin transport system substrate-binding protein